MHIKVREMEKRNDRLFGKEVDKLENEKEWEEDTEGKVKINWPRIILLGFITAVVFLIIDVGIVLILFYGFENEMVFILYGMQYVLFGEAAIIIFIGACLGNFGQSAMVSTLKERFFGSEPLSKDSFREATFNAFTYFSGGAFLLFFDMILWQILRITTLL